MDGRVLWANLALLFWLTLIPFVIRWIGEEGIMRWPVAAYRRGADPGRDRLSAARTGADRGGGRGSRVKAAVGAQAQGVGRASRLCVAAVWRPLCRRYISVAIYIAVAAMWLVPDRRFETRPSCSRKRRRFPPPLDKGSAFGKLARNHHPRGEEGRQDGHRRRRPGQPRQYRHQAQRQEGPAAGRGRQCHRRLRRRDRRRFHSVRAAGEEARAI